MFLAMSLYPEVLKKAHSELDTIVGPRRLPDFDDYGSLVYIQAIVKECLRWQNVLPLGVPHSTIADDEFHGYFIPAGTVLIPNVWYASFAHLSHSSCLIAVVETYRACMHDPDEYDSPDEFNPDRFVRDGKLDDTACHTVTTLAFGFGRRYVKCIIH